MGSGYTVGRRLPVERASSLPQARTADDAIDELEAMIGLGPVKDEVNKLLASLEVERKRREQNLPVAVTSRHMVSESFSVGGVMNLGSRATVYLVLQVAPAANKLSGQYSLHRQFGAGQCLIGR